MAIDWSVLSNVSYEYIQNLDQNFWYGKATFGEEVLALDGAEISITGYIIPTDVGGGNYYLSAYHKLYFLRKSRNAFTKCILGLGRLVVSCS